MNGVIERMAYDMEFKCAVLKYLESGHTQQSVSEKFMISETTLREWKKRLATGEGLAPRIRKRKPKKIEPEKLIQYISEHPNGDVKEISEYFCCTRSAVQKALKRNGLLNTKGK